MPAKSEKQRKLFGLALSVKRGDTPRKDVGAAVLKLVDSMSEKQMEKYTKSVDESEITEATTSASSGAYETPFGVSSKSEMKMLNNLKENKTMNITIEQIERIVKTTLINEEVYSEKPTTSSTPAFNQTGEGKGKETSTKSAKTQKVYDSKAGKTTASSTKKSGENSKKSTSDSIAKVAKNQKNNLKDKAVVDVNKNKAQNEDQRIEANQNGMEDITYDNISDAKQKQNALDIKNDAAMGDPNAQDTGVNQQMIDDAKKRQKSKESSKFRKAKVYGSDVVHIDGAESPHTKKLAFENTMKRLKFKKTFKDSKDMLSRIPKKFKANDIVFEMYDGEDKFKIRWEGNKASGVGVILEHRNDKKEKQLFEHMNHLANFGKKEIKSKEINESSKDVFKNMLSNVRDLSEDVNIKDLSTQGENKVFSTMLKEAKLKEAKLLKKKIITEVNIHEPIGDKSQNDSIRNSPHLVRMAQNALNNVIKTTLRVDGIFGRNTKNAISKYHKQFTPKDFNKTFLDVSDMKNLFYKLAFTGWKGAVGRKGLNDRKDVSNLQTMLNVVIDANLVVDGIYGRNTQAAIEKYNNTRGMDGKRIFDKESWYDMRRYAPEVISK